jgi:chloramphenicol O-acetyltransferase type A
MRSSGGGFVDLKKWSRRAHYELFRTYRQPFFSVTADVDVTSVWHTSRKPGGPPFFLASLFLMLKAANHTAALRRRLRSRGVWEHERVGAGATIARSDGTFGFVRLEAGSRLEPFVTAGKTAIAKAGARTALEPVKQADDIIFHSVLPWLRFTSFANALPGNDSIPRIVFGRCTRERRRMIMPVSVEVHHAVVDGLDVAQFFERFSDELKT